ncbi:permease prefix domain 1-containing protein [Gryllotalpicola protaetiae]|uniref:DUF4153 domain-containing protein n=1 Tax=Gryllotalpicola protaetiae TaxID=2419771 RepID=A0A387BMV7_9MICO|nr:permease prefix domain 1-containing protein [Gryllotalpicola protaetiae]AYG03354.1 hypothetical protein D7I44_07295 [Gryllotalpicola protaetiae]
MVNRTDLIDPEGAIASWRAYLVSRGSVSDTDADELEDHLRSQIDALHAAGLDADEAVLIAIKRMGRQDEIAGEFARENSRRLWKQLVVGGDTRGRRLDGGGVVFGFAALAALLAKLPGLLGAELIPTLLGGGILALATLGASIAWRSRPPRALIVASALGFALLFVLAFAYPFGDDAGDTVIIFGLHAPVALWLLVGLLYAGADWRTAARRMDFVRFSGEWVIYLALIGIGGGVLMGITAAVFSALGADPSVVLLEWVGPCGAAGAAVVAAWLVDSKQEVIENMAPVLGRVFTPLFTVAVLAMLVGAIVTGGFGAYREVLIVVDVLLVVVTGLVLYVLSAQQPTARAGWTERLQLVLVLAAFALNGFALTAMIGRTADGGFTPNRVVALGVNAVLLVGLAGSAWLLGRRVFAGDASTRRLVAWQTGYLPVYGAWALVAAVALPPLFAFA